jgi:hypothetical protein
MSILGNLPDLPPSSNIIDLMISAGVIGREAVLMLYN